MLKKSKIILLAYILAIGGLIWWAYPIIKNRYFIQEEEKKEVSPAPQPAPEQMVPSEQAEEKGEEEQEEDYPTPKEEPDVFLEVSKKDCDNQCASFKDPNELKYCRQICGLEPIKKNITGCDNLEGLEKDYCLKDLAVAKKDFKICDQVEDSSVKKTCVNRVTEEIFNNQE